MTKIKNIVIIFILIVMFSSFTLNASAFIDKSSIKIKPLSSSITKFIETDNFYKVDNNYYRGGQPREDDYITFALLGIKTIINLRNSDAEDIEKQKIIARRFGINYINIPMKASTPPTNDQISYFFKLLDNPKNLPVYVHCWQGRDRTGIMTALYRVKDYGWNYNQAYEEMRERGYHSLIFPKHKSFLQNFIKNFSYNKISE